MIFFRFLKVTFLALLAFSATAQEEIQPSKWRGSLAIGHYEAIIGLPTFSPLRIGGNIGASYHLNKSQRHQLRQAVYLGGFYHSNLQTAVQLYTEFQYEWHIKQFSIMPLAIGGGYVASFPDMTSLVWDGTQYTSTPSAMRSNFLINLGPTIGYQLPIKVVNRPLSLTLGYRLQVQGVMVEKTVPVIAYSSLQLGAAVPF